MNVGELVASLQLDTSEFDSGLSKAEGSASGFGSKLGGLLTAGAMGAIAGLTAAIIGIGGAALTGAADASQGAANLQAQLGVTAEEAQRLQGVANQVFAQGFTGSMTEASAAIAETRQQLGDLTDQELLGVTTGAEAIGETFGVEAGDVKNAVRSLMTDMGISHEQAMDFITTGFQKGLNSSGDFLDSITEYSPQFGQLGADAGEFLSVLETGLQGGALGTDKAADAMKEFGIRLLDGSATTSHALSQLGIDTDALFAGIENGSITGMDAFNLVQTSLAGIQDPLLQNQIGVALFGTQWEDMGAAAMLGIDTTKVGLEGMAGATDGLNAKYQTFGAMWDVVWRQVIVALLPVGNALLNLANAAMPYVMAALGWFQAVLPGIMAGAQAVVATMVGVVSGLFNGQLGSSVNSGRTAFTVAQSTIASVMAAIQSVVSAVLNVVMGFWRQNGASIMAFVGTTWNQISGIISGVMAIIQAVIVPIWTAIAGFISSNQSTIVALLTNAWNAMSGLIKGVLGFIQGIINAVLAAIQGDWGKAWESLKQACESLVLGMWAVLKGAFENGKLMITTVGGAIKDKLVEVWTDAKDAVIKKAEGLRDDAVAKVRELKDKIAELASEFLSVAQNTGKNIAQGIANGIRDGASAIVNAARDAANAALDAAKKLLGIKSPSREAAAQIGLPFSQGIAAGITQSGGLVTSAITDALMGAMVNVAASDVGRTQNFYLNASYANMQSEGSLRDDVRTLQLLGAGL